MEIPSKLTIAQKIKLIRKKRGMTQDELGRLSGINAGNIRKYESGSITNPTYKTLQKLANALEVPVYFFASGSNNEQTIKELDDEVEKFLKSDTFKTRNTIINNLFSALNDIGQDKAIEQVEMLTKIPEYQKTAADQQQGDEQDKK